MAELASRRKFFANLGGAAAVSLASFGNRRASLFPTLSGRIGHMHCKDVARKADGTYEWAAMGRGIIDYVGQFRALVQAGYRGTMSLKTHWRGTGSEEEFSHQSFAGMKELLAKADAL